MGSAALLMSKPSSFLFVCLGNICRSPAMKGILEHRLEERKIPAYVESCGLHGLFLGSPPDQRMQKEAKNHGITLSNHSKLFEISFFDQFDLIFCATQAVLSALKAMASTAEHQKKLFLMSHFSKAHHGDDIFDPYHYGDDGFEKVWEVMDECCMGIIDHFYP